MPLNARAKGANGEREFCEWLSKNFSIPKPERNLEQVREGGADILCRPFAFEIKRCENILLQKWWTQINTAVSNQHGKAFGLEPVVAFRVNAKDWEFLISAKHIGVFAGYLHMPAHVWKKWAMNYIERLVTVEKQLINLELVNV